MGATAKLIDHDFDTDSNGAFEGSRWVVFADTDLETISRATARSHRNVFLGIGTQIEETAENAHRRRLMIDMLQNLRLFEVHGSIEDVAPNPISVRRAVDFLNRLPDWSQLPKMSGDGEGDVMFIWEEPLSIIVTVEGNMLHAVSNAGEPNARHLDNLEYTGGEIPSAVLNLVPKS